MLSVIQVVVLFIFPAVAIIAAKKNKVLAWISPVVLCYAFGIMLANLPDLPLNLKLSNTMTEAMVVLAIPLLLFSTDFVRWLRLAKKTMLSFALGVVAITISSSVGALIFMDQTPEFYKIAGMLIGVYTGGTGNMTAIGKALEVSDEVFIMLNIADVAICSFYLIFLMTVAQRVLHLFLPRFEKSENADDCGVECVSLADLQRNHQIKNLAIVLSLAIASAGLSIGGSFLFFGSMSVAFIIICLTTLAIGASFVERIRNIEGSFELGQYLLLVFCVSIGTLASADKLADAMGPIFYITLIAVVGAVLLHFLFAAIFRIDADTVIITSTAAVFSPAFVGPIAEVLKNKEIVVSGVTTGVVGFAVGNYLGLIVAYVLDYFF
jgi:uncharacterized membrane protein